ncbi:MAG: ferrous iron transport protein A [Bacteroidetes bacterium]|nr:ferrous iron transport protein A [Bacteroidota bacterium]
MKKPLRPKKTLKELQVGDVAQIVEFSNPNDMSKKIEAMGLRRGKQVEVLQRLGRGILVKTNNSSL